MDDLVNRIVAHRKRLRGGVRGRYRAAIEEGDDADVRTLFETHFFGAGPARRICDS
jgi:hypothetical protein